LGALSCNVLVSEGMKLKNLVYTFAKGIKESERVFQKVE
jgi:hypothetical protein